MIEVRLADNTDQERWDHYVAQHADASPYLRFAWGHAVEAAYAHKPYYFMAQKEGEIVGVMPLVHMKSLLGTTHQLVSLPFCDLGGVLANSQDILIALFEKALSTAKSLKSSFLEVRTADSPDTMQQETLGPVQTKSHKVRMVLDLPGTSEQIWGNFKSKLRSQIRKAEKNGCTFSWGGLEQLDVFYRVFSMNMRDLGSPVHSKKWFAEVIKTYGKALRMALVYFEKEIIAVGIMLTNGTQAAIPWASTLRRHNSRSPNMLLYWNFIKYAADHGFAQFDFGRSSPNEGTYNFKAQWGAVPVPLYWHFFTTQGQTMKADLESSATRAWVAQAWRRLPLGLANCIGPVIRRQISL